MQWRFTFISVYGTTVIDEPIGWSDVSISLKRDMNSHGLFFDYGFAFLCNCQYLYVYQISKTI